MIAPTQIRKPENWQDFEKLCKKLWGEIWQCSDTIQRNGRNGQEQKGVDVYGLPHNAKGYFGIQCKGKDDYTKSQLTRKEINEELEKALTFKPKLERFIFATTANKNVGIEEYIREKNLEYRNKGLFEIYVSFWEDIVDLLEERRDTYNWYINNCQYKEASKIEISFRGKQEYEINPKYFRTTTIYELEEKEEDIYPLSENSSISEIIKTINRIKKENNLIEIPKIYRNPLNPPRKVDYRWCNIPIFVKNIGNTVIEDSKLYLIFDSNNIEKLDDKFRYCDNIMLGDAMRAEINASRKESREVFQPYTNVIEFIPKPNVLVQSDYKSFEIGVKPKDDIKEIEIKWAFKSRNYKDEGELLIKVVPEYEEKEKIVKTDKVLPNKVTITPKIVEK